MKIFLFFSPLAPTLVQSLPLTVSSFGVSGLSINQNHNHQHDHNPYSQGQDQRHLVSQMTCTTRNPDDTPLVCKNGGRCAAQHDYWIDLITEEDDGAVCDCSTAVMDIGEDAQVRFVGRDCSLAVERQDYCHSSDRDSDNDHNNHHHHPSDSSLHPDLFCIHGGQCRTHATNFQQRPCDCPPGFVGRHCQYPVENDHDYDEYDADNDNDQYDENDNDNNKQNDDQCHLDCSGNGICVHGLHSRPGDGANGQLYNKNNNHHHKHHDHLSHLFQHCACDEGYAGAACDYEYVQCSNGGHYCFHGSSCKTVDGEDQCDCNVNHNGGSHQKLAGFGCEYHATDACDMTPMPLPTRTMLLDPMNGMTMNDLPFCVNGGLCVLNDVDDKYYCECEQGRFEGKRCEIQVHEEATPIATPEAAPVAAPVSSPVLSPQYAPTEQGYLNEVPTDNSNVGGPWGPFGPTGQGSDEEEFPSSSSSEQLKFEGGAILGIVVVAVAGLAASGFLALRHHRKSRANNHYSSTGGGFASIEGEYSEESIEFNLSPAKSEELVEEDNNDDEQEASPVTPGRLFHRRPLSTTTASRSFSTHGETKMESVELV